VVAAVTESAHSNRLVLLLIAGLPVTMILLATWLWYFVERGDIDLVQVMGTANRGELLSPPLPLQDLTLFNSDGEPVQLFTPDNSLWRILIPAADRCEEECEQRLYYTRQIRTAMGKYEDRIERIYLGGDRQQAALFPQALQAQHPGLKILYTPGSVLEDLREAADAQHLPAYYLVDPRGWVMMSYNAEMDGKAIMADLKFLLKNSSG
jgi:cytochrome oxidase Cu insertion factor (SCO1/SenC/PrrC family)